MRRIALLAASFLLLAVPGARAWTWPAGGEVLSPFVFDPAHPYAGGQHRGIDIAAASGEPIVAPAAGSVSFAGSVPGGGPTLTILTPDGYAVTLLHLGSLAVARGAAVAEGQTVGAAGSGGSVYLGVRLASDPQGYVDPLGFLPVRTAPATAPPDAAPAPEPVPLATPVPAPEPAPAAAGDPSPAPDAGACRRRCPDRHRARARRRSAAGRPACRRPSGARRRTCSGRLACRCLSARRPRRRPSPRPSRSPLPRLLRRLRRRRSLLPLPSPRRRPSRTHCSPCRRIPWPFPRRSRRQSRPRAGATARAAAPRLYRRRRSASRLSSSREPRWSPARSTRRCDRCRRALRVPAPVGRRSRAPAARPRPAAPSELAPAARPPTVAAQRGSSCSHAGRRIEVRPVAVHRATPRRRRPPPEGALGDSRGGGRAPRRRRSRPPRRGGCRGPPSYHPDA